MLVIALKISSPHTFAEREMHCEGLPNEKANTPRAIVVYNDTIAKLVVESSFFSKTFIAMVYIAQLNANPNVRTMPIIDAFVEKSRLKIVTPTIPIITMQKEVQNARLFISRRSSAKKISDIATVHSTDDFAKSVMKAGLI